MIKPDFTTSNTAFASSSVILGSAYTHRESLTDIEKKDPKIKILSSLNEKEMLSEIKKADLAIIPSSGILLEVLAGGAIPLICYYAENQKKGNFFRYLTLASLVFTTKAYLDYSNTLKAEDAAYLEYKNAVSQDDIESMAQIYRDESEKISQNLVLLGVGGGVTAAIWTYNIIHLNSFLSSDNLSYENSNLNIGITPNGRLQAQITF